MGQSAAESLCSSFSSAAREQQNFKAVSYSSWLFTLPANTEIFGLHNDYRTE